MKLKEARAEASTKADALRRRARELAATQPPDLDNESHAFAVDGLNDQAGIQDTIVKEIDKKLSELSQP